MKQTTLRPTKGILHIDACFPGLVHMGWSSKLLLAQDIIRRRFNAESAYVTSYGYDMERVRFEVTYAPI